MSYLPISELDIKSGKITDAFNRLRVSNPQTLFDTVLEYDELPFYWDTHTEGTGSITHLPNESSIALDVGTALGDRVVRQSKRHIRHSAGKSTLVMLTTKFNPKANVVQRAGYFDDLNGLFFEHDGGNLKVVKRSKTSGSAVDTSIPQSEWNIDRMDGTGISGLNLDHTKAQLYVIDFSWLGLGGVRFGVYLNGEIRYVHRMDNGNFIDTVYIQTPHLPLRYEIKNTNTTTSATSMKQICSVVITEGGREEDVGFMFSAGTGTTPKTIGVRQPVVSFRPKLAFKGKANRINIVPKKYSLYSAGNQPVFYEIVWNGTLTGASWKDVHTESSMVYDMSATDIVGGKITHSDYLSGRSTETQTLNLKAAFTTNYDATDADVITIVATSLSSAGDVYANMTWKEIY